MSLGGDMLISRETYYNLSVWHQRGELCPCYFGGWEAASFSLISAQHQALILGKRLILGKLDLASSSSSSREYDSASQRNWNEKAKFLTSTAQFPLKRQTKTSINFKLSAWVGGDPESWSQGAQNHFYHTIYCFWVCFFFSNICHTFAAPLAWCSPQRGSKKVFYKPSIAVNLLTTCRRNFLSTQNP